MGIYPVRSNKMKIQETEMILKRTLEKAKNNILESQSHFCNIKKLIFNAKENEQELKHQFIEIKLKMNMLLENLDVIESTIKK